MTDVATALIVQRIRRTHGWLLGVSEELTPEQFARRLAPTATPAGWHLWHIARWADRLQASGPDRPAAEQSRWDPALQIWTRDKLATAWGLNPGRLGILETGPGMTDDDAAAVASVGKDAVLDYARRAFLAADEAAVKLGDVAHAERNSIQEYRIDEDRRITEVAGARVAVASDLAFHLSHGSRHLGCIEALRGLLDMHGTATA